MSTERTGVALVRSVIERVRDEGLAGAFGETNVPPGQRPKPVAREVLDRVRLDGGQPLTPCMKEWLAFDGSLFGWVDERGAVMGKKLLALTRGHFAEFGSMFASLERSLLTRGCYALPFGERDALHFVYPSRPDSIGELPVLSAEPDNARLGIAFPGIDVFLAKHAGLLEKEWRPQFADRLAEHATNTLRGKEALEVHDADFPDAADPDVGANAGGPPRRVLKAGSKFLLNGDGPVPDGYVVLNEARNPFTKERLRELKKV